MPFAVTSPTDQPTAPCDTNLPPRLHCSVAAPPMVIRSSLELDRALHKADLQCAGIHPLIVSLYTRGYRAEIGLGLPRSFVCIQRCEPALGSRVITVGDVRSVEGAVFLLLDGEKLEIPGRNLLPASDARMILREFFNTGIASTSFYWESA